MIAEPFKASWTAEDCLLYVCDTLLNILLPSPPCCPPPSLPSVLLSFFGV